MIKTKSVNDDWGDPVIYVKECKKFEYEPQPDLPKLNAKHKKKVYINNERLPILNKDGTLIIKW